VTPRAPKPWLLFATVLVIATAGIVYELVAGAMASYVLGDSVTQFSLVIGVYLSALGLGAFLSKFIKRNLERTFVEVELATALAGGSLAPALFLSYAHTGAFQVVLYGGVILVGTLVGVELPLLIRILREQVSLADLLAKALTFDYVGSLVGSVLFSIVLVPRLGLVRTSLLFGVLNAVVGILSSFMLDDPKAPKLRGVRVRGVVVAALLLAAISQADKITSLGEEAVYADEVVHAKQTAYQRIVVTRGRSSFQLFLSGNLQFSSGDEYRYHEALVHPAMAVVEKPRRVLVAGGGDGLAVREILRHPSVKEVTLVELDPEMTKLAREFPLLHKLNEGAFDRPEVKVIHNDAMVWLKDNEQRFDVIVVDFPDPNNFALGKLYTTGFYRLAKKHLAEGGAMVVQATSPMFARRSFWCIVRTIEAAGFSARPYHAFVPSFGEWGYVLAKQEAFDVPTRVPVDGLRWLDDDTMQAMFVLGRDVSEVPVEINRLNNQLLVHYYEHEWRRWN
jgi:spermidine synthase